ncbi:MAG: adenine deaminase [Anaerolineales bacterium]|nr:adenine deaminase [Anaerolineales bacterium]MCB9144332.1 adenine deaminase [Anaerolineales bacterium]
MTSSTKLTAALIDVAMGRAHADLVIKNGKWVSVQSGEIIPNTDIAVVQGRVAFVGRGASHTIGAKTKLIDANGKYLVPGLLDAHMHVESGMVTVTEFVRAVAVRGTTGMFIDPHEIANVFGLKGVKLMVDEAQKQPIHVWVQMPSCVPSAPGLETPGASIGPKEVTEAMTWKGIIGLGEMMNFPGVFMSDKKMLDEMSATHAAGKTIGGHYASPDLGLPFHGYVAGGAEDDHEGTRMEDAIARVRQGMKAMLRYGSAWFDVAAQVKAITEKKLDSRRFILCTDDSHAATLTEEGHMDRVLRHAIGEGLNPMTAIQMMTINTAEHFGLTKEMGMIAPGRWADVVLVDDLMNFKADLVIAKGEVIAKGGEWQVELPVVKYPKWATNSVHLKRKLTAADFVLRTRAANGSEVEANVIGVIENQAPTRHLKLKVKAEDGEVKADIKRDIAKIALVERHKATGKVVVGLVNGFEFTRKCAIASTVAHDSHHMIVVGNDDESMAVAANELVNCGGGQVVVMDSKVVGLVEFPIAGLMSNERADVVAKKAGTVLDGFKMCGSELNNPNMQLSLMALVVIPQLRISDKGLVDVTRFDFIPVLED